MEEAMPEFLDKQEIKTLTGYKTNPAASQWLKLKGIPFKFEDGKRLIVSRLHVQRWLEGKTLTPHSGMNISAIR